MNRKRIRFEARSILKRKPSVLLVTLLLIVIVAVSQLLIMCMNGTFEALEGVYRNMMAGNGVSYEPDTATGFGWILTVLLRLLGVAVVAGYSLYCLRISRRVQAGAKDVFDTFQIHLRILWLFLIPRVICLVLSLMYFLPVVWIIERTGVGWVAFACLPLLIPMVYYSYFFRQALFIQLDYPHIPAFECLLLSKRVMEDHRRALFKLDISFIGWWFLCAIPGVMIWVLPYMRVAHAIFYSSVMEVYAVQNGLSWPPESRFWNEVQPWDL